MLLFYRTLVANNVSLPIFKSNGNVYFCVNRVVTPLLEEENVEVCVAGVIFLNIYPSSPSYIMLSSASALCIPTDLTVWRTTLLT